MKEKTVGSPPFPIDSALFAMESHKSKRRVRNLLDTTEKYLDHLSAQGKDDGNFLHQVLISPKSKRNKICSFFVDLQGCAPQMDVVDIPKEYGVLLEQTIVHYNEIAIERKDRYYYGVLQHLLCLYKSNLTTHPEYILMKDFLEYIEIFLEYFKKIYLTFDHRAIDSKKHGSCKLCQVIETNKTNFPLQESIMSSLDTILYILNENKKPVQERIKRSLNTLLHILNKKKESVQESIMRIVNNILHVLNEQKESVEERIPSSLNNILHVLNKKKESVQESIMRIVNNILHVLNEQKESVEERIPSSLNDILHILNANEESVQETIARIVNDILYVLNEQKESVQEKIASKLNDILHVLNENEEPVQEKIENSLNDILHILSEKKEPECTLSVECGL